MSEENKAIIRRLYNEVHSGGNIDVIDEIYAHDVEIHVPGLPQDPYGPESIKQMISTIRNTFPGVMVTIEEILADDDKVVAYVAWRGPHVGREQGASPYAPMVGWPRIDIYRLFDGKIVEQWADRDDAGALHQLGIT